MKASTPPLTSDLFYHGTPEQLAPYIIPCPAAPSCFCKAMGHLRSWAQRQLLADWDRLDQQLAELRRWRDALPPPETIRQLLTRLGRKDLIEDWMP